MYWTFFFIHLELMHNLISVLNFSISFFKYDMSVYFVFTPCSIRNCHEMFSVISVEIFKIGVHMFLCSTKSAAVLFMMIKIILFFVVFLTVVITTEILVFSNILLILFWMWLKTIFILKFSNLIIKRLFLKIACDVLIKSDEKKNWLFFWIFWHIENSHSYLNFVW